VTGVNSNFPQLVKQAQPMSDEHRQQATVLKLTTQDGRRIGVVVEGGGGPPEGHEIRVFASEEAMANVLVQTRFNGNWRYASDGRWYHFNERCWFLDETAEIYDLARMVCRSTAASDGLSATVKRSICSARSISGVERVARSDRMIAVAIEAFDSDPWVLNTPDGLVDLRTGQLLPHDKDRLCMRMAGASPQPGKGPDIGDRREIDVGRQGAGKAADLVQDARTGPRHAGRGIDKRRAGAGQRLRQPGLRAKELLKLGRQRLRDVVGRRLAGSTGRSGPAGRRSTRKARTCSLWTRGRPRPQPAQPAAFMREQAIDCRITNLSPMAHRLAGGTLKLKAEPFEECPCGLVRNGRVGAKAPALHCQKRMIEAGEQGAPVAPARARRPDRALDVRPLKVVIGDGAEELGPVGKADRHAARPQVDTEVLAHPMGECRVPPGDDLDFCHRQPPPVRREWPSRECRETASQRPLKSIYPVMMNPNTRSPSRKNKITSITRSPQGRDPVIERIGGESSRQNTIGDRGARQGMCGSRWHGEPPSLVGADWVFVHDSFVVL
jgi:hypothetical protein